MQFIGYKVPEVNSIGEYSWEKLKGLTEKDLDKMGDPYYDMLFESVENYRNCIWCIFNGDKLKPGEYEDCPDQFDFNDDYEMIIDFCFIKEMYEHPGVDSDKLDKLCNELAGSVQISGGVDVWAEFGGEDHENSMPQHYFCMSQEVSGFNGIPHSFSESLQNTRVNYNSIRDYYYELFGIYPVEVVEEVEECPI